MWICHSGSALTTCSNYTEQKYKCNTQQFQRFYWVTVHIKRSEHFNKFIRPYLGARPSQSEWVFPHRSALLQTIPQVKKLDVEALGWRGYTWSVVVRPVGRISKFSKTILEVAYGREMNIQFSGKSSGGHSCSQHANCTLPQNLRHLWHCVLWQNCIF